jgi:ABC-type multidrug transport system fused ATPase/permease subunit
MLGVFIDRFLLLSIGVACFFYLILGLSRLLSMLIDGMPSEAIVSATIIELVIGLICLFLFLTTKKKTQFGDIIINKHL